MVIESTTVEIILYYLTTGGARHSSVIYNSRNYSILLNVSLMYDLVKSTTVEIILYYLTIAAYLFEVYLQQ